MDIINDALDFERKKLSLRTRDERIRASLKLKSLILSINEIYKKKKDPMLMDIMKRLTLLKRRAESRLKPRMID